MKPIANLKYGDILNNYELKSIFQCGLQGGMRRSQRTNSLVIITNHVKSIYIDRWDNNILYYTGMGTKGDQSFDFMQNKTLYNSNSNNISIYLFEVFIDKEYTFIGQVALADKPFFETQTDRNNNERKVCIFPIKVLNNDEPSMAKNIFEKSNEIRKRRIKKLDNKSLLILAKRANPNPSNRLIMSKQYERNEAVAEYAKRLAKGVCLLCGKEAPFIGKDGEPYLETHHIDWLAEGGSDTLENTVALCPNCHKKMHIIDSKQDREYLKKVIKKLLSETN